KNVDDGFSYKYNLKGIYEELFKSLQNENRDPNEDIVCIFVPPLSGLASGKHRWAALKEIQLGESKDLMTISRDVDIPLSTLLEGSQSDAQPTLVLSVPPEFKQLWRVLVFADGSKSDPVQVRMGKFDFDQYKEK
ncbi:MAG: hypothetical protein AAF558_05910, partial [Verrucomicrobiota bacterium]